VPDFQSAQDVEDMFVWYKRKQAARRRAASGNLYKARYERGGPLTRKERLAIRRSMDYVEAHKEIQRRAQLSRLEPKEKRVKQKKIVEVQEKAPKFRVREEVEPTQQFARRVGSRTPQVKSVYSLLREILSKKVERLEEARVADEKAKAQGKSGFSKLEN